MDVTKHNLALDQLEALVDGSSYRGVLQLLAEVASAKADHIRETWQDEALADAHDKIAIQLLNAGERVQRLAY